MASTVEVLQGVAIGVGAVGGIVGMFSGLYTSLRYKDIERSRAEIQTTAVRQQTRFTSLHQKQAEVLGTLYQRLVRAERAISYLVEPMELAGEPTRDERTVAAVSAANDFRDWLLETRIYLDADLCEQIEGFDKHLFQAFTKFRISQEPRHPGTPTIDRWLEAYQSLRDEAPKMRRAIEDEMRELLGVAD